MCSHCLAIACLGCVLGFYDIYIYKRERGEENLVWGLLSPETTSIKQEGNWVEFHRLTVTICIHKLLQLGAPFDPEKDFITILHPQTFATRSITYHHLRSEELRKLHSYPLSRVIKLQINHLCSNWPLVNLMICIHASHERN